MRAQCAAFILAASLITTGCVGLRSVQPLAVSGNTTYDPSLLGAWSDAEHENVFIVREGRDLGYDILWSSDNGKDSLRLNAKLVQLGPARVLDVTEAAPGTFSVPCHVFVEVRAAGGGIEIALLASKWLGEQARGQSTLAQFELDKDVILTAPAGQVSAFLLKYASRDEARDEPLTVYRR
jgi:hypothetical protein